MASVKLGRTCTIRKTLDLLTGRLVHVKDPFYPTVYALDEYFRSLGPIPSGQPQYPSTYTQLFEWVGIIDRVSECIQPRSMSSNGALLTRLFHLDDDTVLASIQVHLSHLSLSANPNTTCSRASRRSSPSSTSAKTV